MFKPFPLLVLGLKHFSGQKHKDLFIDDDIDISSKVTNSKKLLPSKTTDAADDSDSDSDYDYFKVQKQMQLQTRRKDSESSDDNESHAKEAPNTFNDALRSAITEDELVLPASVNQTFLVVPMKLRLVTLCSLIVEHCVLNNKGGKMIIFMATLEMVDYHSELIETVLTGKSVGMKKKDKIKTKKKKKPNSGDVVSYFRKQRFLEEINWLIYTIWFEQKQN